MNKFIREFHTDPTEYGAEKLMFEELRAEGCVKCGNNLSEKVGKVFCTENVPDKYRGCCSKFRVR